MKCMMKHRSYLWKIFLMKFNKFMQVNFVKELETSFWDFVKKIIEEMILWNFCYRNDIFPCSLYNFYFYGIVSSKWFKSLIFNASTFYSKSSYSIGLFCIVWRHGTWSVYKNSWVLFLCLCMINTLEIYVRMWG